MNSPVASTKEFPGSSSCNHTPAVKTGHQLMCGFISCSGKDGCLFARNSVPEIVILLKLVGQVVSMRDTDQRRTECSLDDHSIPCYFISILIRWTKFKEQQPAGAMEEH